jgi:prephenate dehydrogenase
MACISHLPHVLANLLAAQAAGTLGAPGEDPEHMPVVGPSFRDAIRVAGANSAIWTDIYLSNADALGAAIAELEERLAVARAMLARGEAGAVGDWIEGAREDRDALLAAGMTGGSAHELRIQVPNRPGVVAEIALALGEAGVNIGDLVLSPSPDNSRGVIALWIGGEETAARAEAIVGELGFQVVRA